MAKKAYLEGKLKHMSVQMDYLENVRFNILFFLSKRYFENPNIIKFNEQTNTYNEEDVKIY